MSQKFIAKGVWIINITPIKARKFYDCRKVTLFRVKGCPQVCGIFLKEIVFLYYDFRQK